MKNLYPILAILLLMTFSSCQTYEALDAVRGGHSPMMMLDGEWIITESYTRGEDGVKVDLKDAENVDFDSTQDRGGYCYGSWLNLNVVKEAEFWWGVDNDHNEFILQENNTDVDWKIKELNKKSFKIVRWEGNQQFYMEFDRPE